MSRISHGRRGRSATAASILAILVLAVSSCGVASERGDAADGVDPSETTTGSGGDGSFSPDGGDSPDSTSTPTTLPPPTNMVIVGDSGSPVNRIAANAITDLEAFWGETYPAVYGTPYEPVAGGFYAINRNSRPSTLPCGVWDINQVLHNAFYCPTDDAVAWDEENLMPDLAKEYGDFVVAVVLAHEWGHAIQDRAAFDQPIVVVELQADCFAGAWVQHVNSSGKSRFEITTKDLDQALAGVLSLRDAAGAESTDPNAHGSGFDRVSAFQMGFEEGAGRCKDFTVGNPAPRMFAFVGDDKYTQGDLEMDDIIAKSLASLDGYWADIFPALSGGKAWEPMEPARAFTRDDPPTCNGQVVSAFRLFLCVPDRYVGYESATVADAYRMGDFAVATLFATQYGLEVQDQLLKPPGTEAIATVRGDCFSGAWAAALLAESQPDPAQGPRYTFHLKPGDLDEGVRVLLTFRSEADRQRQGPGFARVKAFRTGVLSGPGACIDLTA